MTADLRAIGSAINDATDSVLGFHNVEVSSALSKFAGIKDSYKPFTSDNEVSNRPAAQQWTVCTP